MGSVALGDHEIEKLGLARLRRELRNGVEVVVAPSARERRLSHELGRAQPPAARVQLGISNAGLPAFVKQNLDNDR